jgi:hypothetical protein
MSPGLPLFWLKDFLTADSPTKAPEIKRGGGRRRTDEQRGYGWLLAEAEVLLKQYFGVWKEVKVYRQR